MAFEIRRIVSGHNAQGKSVFIMDGMVGPPAGRRSSAGTTVAELWQTATTPADNSGDKDPTDHPFRLPPPANGSVFRVVEYPPDKERFAAMSSQDWSADAKSQGYHRDAGNARHAGYCADELRCLLLTQSGHWVDAACLTSQRRSPSPRNPFQGRTAPATNE